MSTEALHQQFVRWFRDSTPYINAFRGRTFVVSFGGELLAEDQFNNLLHDLVLLNSLGVRLVLVHGARPQIVSRLEAINHEMLYINGLRVTDARALECVKEAIGSVRVEIESQLSMGLANSPMAGSQIRVVSGNFVTAKPLGIHNGVDYLHTGEVRRIDTGAIEQQLANGSIVLLSPLGYSPTGEIFNLYAEDVAKMTAVELGADKLIFLSDLKGVMSSGGDLIRELKLEEAQSYLEQQQTMNDSELRSLASAVSACSHGIERAHIINRNIDGALLIELFTRDGSGTMISAERYEKIRHATIDDVGGVLELIKPMEQSGVLVRRSRELLEMEIGHFMVIERDGTIIGCAALYPYSDEQCAELACVAIHSDYRKQGRGDQLLEAVEKNAKTNGIKSLFVLTTQTAHWFQERGFIAGEIEKLPVKKQQLYNFQRQSKVFVKPI